MPSNIYPGGPGYITQGRAQEVLELGLGRWEDYCFPAGPDNCNNATAVRYSGAISDEIMDRCWDIELYLRLEQPSKNLGTYSPDKSRNGKRHGRNYINIFPHHIDGKHYDIEDTVLHELAHHIHSISYPHDREAHGQKWKWICKIVGANPRATQSAVKLDPKNTPKF